MEQLNLYWHRLSPKAVVPSKRDEDAGYDIYTIENDVWIKPFEKRLMSTGLSYAMDENSPFWLFVVDRGSTGSRGLHVHCGVLDSGYRGEVFVCISNDNAYPVHFTDAVDKPTMREKGHWFWKKRWLEYPITKGIAQIVVFSLPRTNAAEIDADTWEKMRFNSERGEGKLGASNK